MTLQGQDWMTKEGNRKEKELTTTPIDGTTRAVVVDGHTVVSYVHDTVFFAAAGSVRSSEVGRADALLAR